MFNPRYNLIIKFKYYEKDFKYGSFRAFINGIFTSESRCKS